MEGEEVLREGGSDVRGRSDEKNGNHQFVGRKGVKGRGREEEGKRKGLRLGKYSESEGGDDIE